MKTYFFSVLLALLVVLYQQGFAAHDNSFPIITAIYEHTSISAEYFGKVTNPSIKYQLSWKERTLSKMTYKKLAKARKSIQQQKKSKSWGGLLTLIVVGVLLIPIGILMLLPLFIVGIVLLTLGMMSAFLGSIRSIFW